jgi:hypothetical protein
MQDLGTLKYRADTLEGLLGNEHAVKTLSELVQSRSLPHLIFYGPENSGKQRLLLLLPGSSMEIPGRTISHTLTLRIFSTRENVILCGTGALSVLSGLMTRKKSTKA